MSIWRTSTSEVCQELLISPGRFGRNSRLRARPEHPIYRPTSPTTTGHARNNASLIFVNFFFLLKKWYRLIYNREGFAWIPSRMKRVKKTESLRPDERVKGSNETYRLYDFVQLRCDNTDTVQLTTDAVAICAYMKQSPTCITPRPTPFRRRRWDGVENFSR